MKLLAEEMSEDAARLALYLLWCDFANGGSDRRALRCEEDAPAGELAAEGQVALLEDFAGWTGGRGGFFRMAVEAGFLRMEPREGGGCDVVCHGFYPLNARLNRQGKSIQRMGGLARSVRSKQRDAEMLAARSLELWERRGDQFDLPEEHRRDALRLILELARVMALDSPADEVLRTGLLRKAHECQRTTDAEERQRVLMWLLAHRDDADVPKDVGRLLAMWDDLCSKSRIEMGKR